MFALSGFVRILTLPFLRRATDLERWPDVRLAEEPAIFAYIEGSETGSKFLLGRTHGEVMRVETQLNYKPVIVWTACMIWQEYRLEIARLLSWRRTSER